MNFHKKTTELQNQVIELQNKIKELEESNKKLTALKNTPIGLRERMRHLKHINNLSGTARGRTRRMRLARDYISQVSGLALHIFEDRVLLLNETMNRLDIIKLLKLPENQKLRKLALKELLKDMNSVVKPSQILEECDRVGVSRRGYRALSGLWFKNLKDQNIKPFGLPRSYNVIKI